MYSGEKALQIQKISAFNCNSLITLKKKVIKISLRIFRKEPCTDKCQKATWKTRRLFVCRYCRVLPAFTGNTIKQSSGATETFHVSKCLKNGTFFCRRNPRESDPWISISVCMIKTLMTEELITSLGWGPCIFVCSSTVNAAVSTQTQTTPQTCLPSRAVCRHQV